MIIFVIFFFQNYAVEIQADDISELEYDNIKNLALKAGGANYGTGVRD